MDQMNHNSVLKLRKFVAPEFIFGAGAVGLTGRYARNLGGIKVLVVTDSNLVNNGIAGQVIQSIEESGIGTATFSDVSPNPPDHEVMAGAEVYKAEDCNLIVAVGGGSPMDCAKGIGIVSSNNRNILDFEGVDNVLYPGSPLICVPTTAGTSADVSQFAIIKDTQRKLKIAIVSKMVVPDAALIDPVLTMSMPPELTASTGVDALTHAIEAYVSNASSPITDQHAYRAIRIISSTLERLMADPLDLELRGEMMLASLHAGLAFSNASLGAVHAMAHSLGGQFDLPHGKCNALLLRHVINANFEAAPSRYCDIGVAMGIDMRGLTQDARKKAINDWISSILENIGLGKGLSSLGVSPEDLPALARTAVADPCMVTNPCRLSAEAVEVIYKNAL